MSEVLEIYVLTGERSVAVAHRFLEAFAPARVPAAVDYPIPQFDDEPRKSFETAEEVVEWLVHEPQQDYSLYWDVGGDVFSHAMLFFTTDGQMIAGLAGRVTSPRDLLNAIAKIVDGQFGYLTLESPPPMTAREFVALCESASDIALAHGVVRGPTDAL